MLEKTKGNLLIIGGAEDKIGKSEILKCIIEIIGSGILTVMTTATELPKDVGLEYQEVFTRLGAKNINILNINTREDANQQKSIEIIQKSSCVFFTGGDQLRITSILGGTQIYTALHDIYRKGSLIAGTSAGASAMSGTMIVDGISNQPARKCTLKMAPGLGLLEGVIIDQHFDQRGRIGRLLCGVSENPSILGIGIDEDTAIRVHSDAKFEVVGSNVVTVIDGRSIKTSNVSELKPDELLAISNVVLHVLPPGYGFDMQTREIINEV